MIVITMAVLVSGAGASLARQPAIEVNWEALDAVERADKKQETDASDQPAEEETATASLPPRLSEEDRAYFTGRVERIGFEEDEAAINFETAESLRAIAERLVGNNVRVEIRAYAPPGGEIGAPRRLSLQRARIVREFMTDLGVADSRISVRAMGAAGAEADGNRADIEFIVP